MSEKGMQTGEKGMTSAESKAEPSIPGNIEGKSMPPIPENIKVKSMPPIPGNIKVKSMPCSRENIAEENSAGSEAAKSSMKYFVLRVESGRERTTEELIRLLVPREMCRECFHLSRHMKKKFHGEWKDYSEHLLPGYVFVISENPAGLYEKLRKVPRLTRLLGRDEDHFTPLTTRDILWLKSFGACEESPVVELSQVKVEEGNKVRVVSGPLQNMEGYIKRIYLHKRYAEVEIPFMGQTMNVHLGIEILEQLPEETQKEEQTGE